MKIVIVAVLLLISSAVVVRADNVEITIHSGWSFNTADFEIQPCFLCLSILPPFTSTTSVDSSISIGIKTAYFLNSRSAIEGSFEVSPNHDVITERRVFCRQEPCPALPDFLFERNMVVYQYDANFLYTVLTGDVQPYFTIGVGGVASDLDNDVKNNFAFNYGGGAKFRFKKVGLRFEFNDHVIPDYFLSNKTAHDLQIQYGFFFRL
ncbi:porin family protein [bacterium]|nr:porin family protein [bacterium]MCI0613963.1 porin family protein [bacterium]